MNLEINNNNKNKFQIKTSNFLITSERSSMPRPGVTGILMNSRFIFNIDEYIIDEYHTSLILNSIY